MFLMQFQQVITWPATAMAIRLDYTASYYLTFRRWLLFKCPFGTKQFDEQRWIDILQVPEESVGDETIAFLTFYYSL